MSFLPVLQLNLLWIWCWDWGWNSNIFDLQARISALALTGQHANRQTNPSLVEMSAGHWFYVWRLWDLDPTSSPGGVLFRAQLLGSLRPFRVQCPTCHLGLMYPAVFDAWNDTLVLGRMEYVVDGRNFARLAGLPTMELRTVHIAAKKVLLCCHCVCPARIVAQTAHGKLTLVLRASPSGTNFTRKRAIMRMRRA